MVGKYLTGVNHQLRNRVFLFNIFNTISMKNIFVAGVLLALWGIAMPACKHQSNKHTGPVAPGTKFICPMNCEKGKTYDQPGTCPVCHMDLETSNAEATANTAEFFTAFTASPAPIELEKPATLSFTPKIKGKENEPVPLDLVHEKKMHLILVSDDLAWFDHLHPEYQAAGTYDIKVLGKGENFSKGRGLNETRFETGGKHLAFTDYKPMGALNQVNKTEIDVTGPTWSSMPYTKQRMTSQVDGYSVVLDPHGAELSTGTPTNLHIDIVEKGKRLTPDKIENYLGAKAHVIMIETSSKEFLHVHPEAAGEELEMNTTFAKPGLYRCWLQFQTAGKVHTADFVLEVKAGTATGAGHEGHKH